MTKPKVVIIDPGDSDPAHELAMGYLGCCCLIILIALPFILLSYLAPEWLNIMKYIFTGVY